jgi:hypothetical protein
MELLDYFTHNLTREPIEDLASYLEDHGIYPFNSPHEAYLPVSHIGVVSTYYLEKIHTSLEMIAGAHDLDLEITNSMFPTPENSDNSLLLYAPRVYDHSEIQKFDEFYKAETIMKCDKNTLWFMDADSFKKYEHILPKR